MSKKGNSIFPHEGSLEDTVGYTLKNAETTRRRKLREAAKIFGKKELLKKLRGLRYVFTNNRTYGPRVRKDIAAVENMRVDKEARKKSGKAPKGKSKGKGGRK